MCSQAGCSPAPPVTPPSSPSLASSRSPSPPILPTVRRRRLWSPPMRRKSLTTSRSRSSASSTAPQLVHRPRPLSSNAVDAQGIRPPSRSRRLGHRSHHDSRPPSKTSCPSDGEADRGRLQHRSPSPSPSSTPTPSPPQTPPIASNPSCSALHGPSMATADHAPLRRQSSRPRGNAPKRDHRRRRTFAGSTGSCAPSRCDEVGPRLASPLWYGLGGMKQISLFMKSVHKLSASNDERHLFFVTVQA